MCNHNMSRLRLSRQAILSCKPILCGCLLITMCGCRSLWVEGPEEPVAFDTYVITVKIYDSYEQLSSSPAAPKIVAEQLKGYAKWSGYFCQIHYVHNDYETLVHELKHCYYGDWHD